MCWSTLISHYRRAFNLRHGQSASTSQPSSSPICAELSTSIIVDLRRSVNLHHHRSAILFHSPSSICNLYHSPSPIYESRLVVFSYFLFISLFQSHASPVSICVLWIYGLLVFGFVDLFFSVDLFSKICEICGLWSLSFGRNQIQPLCTQAWSDSTRDFSVSAAGPPPCHVTKSSRFWVKHKPELNWPVDTLSHLWCHW